LPEETKVLITEYFQPKLKKLFEEQSANPFIYYLPEQKAFKTENLVEVSLSENFIAPQFKIISQGEHFELQCRFNINGASSTLLPIMNAITAFSFYTIILFTCGKTGRCIAGRKIYQEWQYQTDKSKLGSPNAKVDNAANQGLPG
jgi:hypothetical protein